MSAIARAQTIHRQEIIRALHIIKIKYEEIFNAPKDKQYDLIMNFVKNTRVFPYDVALKTPYGRVIRIILCQIISKLTSRYISVPQCRYASQSLTYPGEGILMSSTPGYADEYTRFIKKYNERDYIVPLDAKM